MSGNHRVITDCDHLHMYPYSEELKEEEEANNNHPRFEESGSITLRLQHKFQIRQTTIDRDTAILQDDYTIRTRVTIYKELHCLCYQEFTEYWVNNMFHTLGVNPHAIDIFKTAIVLKAVNWAINTKLRGLKQFGLMADIELTTTREIVREREELDSIMNELREQERRRILLQSKEERNLKRNPALKRGHFESGGGAGDDDQLVKKNCVVCLDDFEIGSSSEVIWMPCSHMFHEGCLLGWLKENKSCPLCRLELPES